MSSSDHRRRFLLLGLAALAGCGYQPAFGPEGPALVVAEQIAVVPPRDPDAFILVEQLERRLGRPDRPAYRLSYRISTDFDGVGVNPAQEIFRYNVVGKVAYTLTRIADDTVVASGSVDTFTSYSAASVDTTSSPPLTNATVATDAARRDAHRRLIVSLADLLYTRLAATAGDWAG